MCNMHMLACTNYPHICNKEVTNKGKPPPPYLATAATSHKGATYERARNEHKMSNTHVEACIYELKVINLLGKAEGCPLR